LNEEVRSQNGEVIGSILFLCNLRVGFAISTVRGFLPQRSQRNAKKAEEPANF
jgi:hypothetical protein